MRRFILLALFLFTCLLANAQHHEMDSIKRYLKLTNDRITGMVTATIKDTVSGISSEGFPFAMVARYNTKESFFAISCICKDAGCVRNRAIVDYIFADGKKKAGWNYVDDNCDGFFMVLYKSWTGIDPREVSIFTTNLLSIIRLNGSKIIEIALTKQQSDLFRSEMRYLKYYADNWKTVNKLYGYD